MRLVLLIFVVLSLVFQVFGIQCGRVQPKPRNALKITNGEDAATGEHPWMVRVGSCGGALISDRHVLTAAHCTRDGRVSVQLGTIVENDTTALHIQSTAYNHPLYRSHNDNRFDPLRNCSIHVPNDIAVLVLDEPVTFSWRIQPVCLGDHIIDELIAEQNLTLLAIGWGFYTDEQNKTSIIQKSRSILAKKKMFFIDDAVCKERLEYWSKTYYSECLTTYPTMFCAGSSTGGVYIQDSGSPLLVELGGVWHQVGVVSWGPLRAGQAIDTYTSPGHSLLPQHSLDVFTQVADYRDFIRSIIQMTTA